MRTCHFFKNLIFGGSGEELFSSLVWLLRTAQSTEVPWQWQCLPEALRRGWQNSVGKQHWADADGIVRLELHLQLITRYILVLCVWNMKCLAVSGACQLKAATWCVPCTSCAGMHEDVCAQSKDVGPWSCPEPSRGRSQVLLSGIMKLAGTCSSREGKFEEEI